MTDDVIRPDFDSLQLQVRRQPTTHYCAHSRVLVDDIARRVYCATCEVELDAFTVLLRLARDEMKLQYDRKEVAKLQHRINALKHDERNTKARLERARRRLKEAEGDGKS